MTNDALSPAAMDKAVVESAVARGASLTAANVTVTDCSALKAPSDATITNESAPL